MNELKSNDALALEFAVQYLSKEPLTPDANIDALDRFRTEAGDYIFEDYLKELAEPGACKFGPGRNFRGWAADFIKHMGGSYGQDRILRRIIQRFIENDEPLPPELRDYFGRVPIPAPVKTVRGPDPRRQGSRNAAITCCIAHLRDRFGLKVFRSEAGRDGVESACSIVTKALERLNAGRSEGAVKRIWQDRCKR